MAPGIGDAADMDRAISTIILCGVLAAGFVPLVRRIADLAFQQMELAGRNPSDAMPFLGTAPAASRAATLEDREREADALMMAHP